MSDLESSRGHPHAPGPSIWPLGFALGLVVLLIGVITAWWIVVLGAVVAVGFGLLWVRELARERGLAHAPEVEPEQRSAAVAVGEPAPQSEPEPATPPGERYSRSAFLEVSTLGLGGVIGGLVTLPALGFMVGPAFLDQGFDDQELGPLEEFPPDQFVVATFMTKPDMGEVTRQTAFIRYNGPLEQEPSFTIIGSRCAHLGCPVQPNAVLLDEETKTRDGVTLIPTKPPSGFGCPCHGGQYDNEGNVTAGPPVRALDRYAFSIRNGRLFLGKPYSVSHVEGTGANARIHKWTFAFPGVHVDGPESWLYPIQPPR